MAAGWRGDNRIDRGHDAQWFLIHAAIVSVVIPDQTQCIVGGIICLWLQSHPTVQYEMSVIGYEF